MASFETLDLEHNLCVKEVLVSTYLAGSVAGPPASLALGPIPRLQGWRRRNVVPGMTPVLGLVSRVGARVASQGCPILRPSGMNSTGCAAVGKTRIGLAHASCNL